MDRRHFLTTSGAIAGGALLGGCVAPTRRPLRPGEKLNIAFIGSGGWIARQPYQQGCKDENLVAFCDVDRNQCAENMKAWRTDQPFFEDFRVMLDKMWKKIDAVVVSTPDHTHFAATMMAMERGIHVYTQKPLTHNIWQARTLRKAKHRYNTVTQMGNQGHASKGSREAVEAYRAGLIGDVKEIYVNISGPDFSTDRYFVRPETMPPPSQPVPDYLNWDCWLGPIAERGYSPDYHPSRWRGFYEMGGGNLGDFGCHTFDTPFWALDLGVPTAIDVLECKPALPGCVVPGSRLDFHFPAKGDRGPITLHYSDGVMNGIKPYALDKFGFKSELKGTTSLIVGDKGVIQSGSHGGTPRIYPTEVRESIKANPPEQLFERVQGGPFREWLRAIKGEGPEPGSNFDYSARLTEMVQLGIVAQRSGKERIEWDDKKMRVTNHPELNALVNEPVRKGWVFGERV